MSRLAGLVSFSILISLCGCGGSSSTPGADAGPGTPAALACDSLAFCSAIQVNTYLGTVATPAGGALADGVYRLAWEVDPADSEWGGVHDSAEVIRIAGGAFVRGGGLANRGTWSTAGTTLSLQVTGACELGTELGDVSRVETYAYTATAGRLTLFDRLEQGSKTWLRERVFVAVTDPKDLCEMAGTTPANPGDSTQCQVSNCYCSYAIGGTVDRNACQ
ncbi:MAG: hypothetical protein K8W52_40035 [Deltaproteobacteria bacterium]|nr:hypothetical protein [Deltaproteobacteria bacterium]